MCKVKSNSSWSAGVTLFAYVAVQQSWNLSEIRNTSRNITPSARGWRVAQAFDLVGITDTVGAPSFAFFCEGRESECWRARWADHVSTTESRSTRSIASVSCRVAPFEFIDPALGLLFRVIHRLAELLPALGALLGSGLLMRFMDLLRGVLGIAPGFLRRTFDLIDHALVGQFLIANAFSDALLHFSHCLSDLASHLILVHF